MTLPLATRDEGGYVRCGQCAKRLTIIVTDSAYTGLRYVWLNGRQWAHTTRPKIEDYNHPFVWQKVARHARGGMGRVRNLSYTTTHGLSHDPYDPSAGWALRLPAILLCPNHHRRRRCYLDAARLGVTSCADRSGTTVCNDLHCAVIVARPRLFCELHGGVERMPDRPPVGESWHIGADDLDRWRSLT